MRRLLSHLRDGTACGLLHTSLLHASLLLAPMVLLISGCSSKVTPTIVPAPTHDTTYITNHQFDSTYVSYIQITQHDTVYITQSRERYKVLRDTIVHIAKDSVPYVVERQVPVRFVPGYYKWPALLLYGICAVAIAYAIARVAIKFYF